MISQNESITSKIKSVLLVILLAFCAHQCNSTKTLTVDDIIQKNIEARGGVENWAKVKNFVMEGIYVSFSEPAPFKIWRQRPDLYRFDSTRINKFVVHAYDGQNAWWINPLMGPPHDKPQIIPSQNNLDKVTLRERLFEPVFWNYTEKSHQVELEENEIFDDKDCYKLKVTLADATIEFWYIDAESFLEIGMTGDTYDFGIKNSLEMFFSDYRDVGGLKFPFLIESEYGQRYRSTEVEHIEINTEIEPSVFVMPDSIEGK
jgi:outer membrane lipoprotein-sorting protein